MIKNVLFKLNNFLFIIFIFLIILINYFIILYFINIIINFIIFNIICLFSIIFQSFFFYYKVLILYLKYFFFSNITSSFVYNIFDFFLNLNIYCLKFIIKGFIMIKLLYWKIFSIILYLLQLYLTSKLFTSTGFSEYFGPFFFSPDVYRFFSFYIGFGWFFISLDWVEHGAESIDNMDSEFEIDFEEIMTWAEDPLIGRNFIYEGQRLALLKTAENPDLFNINKEFYQSKKSKFNLYNREFLGGPEYLNLFDLFTNHETFHQVGSYEFFGPSFIVIFVSYEIDFELDFMIIQKFFHFFKIFFLFFINFQNLRLLIFKFFSVICYIFILFFLFFKYILKELKKILF